MGNGLELLPVPAGPAFHVKLHLALNIYCTALQMGNGLATAPFPCRHRLSHETAPGS
jgi:hypothetical protein